LFSRGPSWGFPYRHLSRMTFRRWARAAHCSWGQSYLTSPFFEVEPRSPLDFINTLPSAGARKSDPSPFSWIDLHLIFRRTFLLDARRATLFSFSPPKRSPLTFVGFAQRNLRMAVFFPPTRGVLKLVFFTSAPLVFGCEVGMSCAIPPYPPCAFIEKTSFPPSFFLKHWRETDCPEKGFASNLPFPTSRSGTLAGLLARFLSRG